MKIFILEDSKERIAIFRSKLIGHELTIAETAADAIRLLDGNAYDIIFLDHDLGGEEMVGVRGKNTGSEVVRWMKPNLTNYCPVIIHSLNAPAAQYMKQELEDVGVEVHCIPFLGLCNRLDDPNFIQQKPANEHDCGYD